MDRNHVGSRIKGPFCRGTLEKSSASFKGYMIGIYIYVYMYMCIYMYMYICIYVYMFIFYKDYSPAPGAHSSNL